jgi:hypothetical protein
MPSKCLGLDNLAARGLSSATRPHADIKSTRKWFGTVRRVVVECGGHGANPLAEVVMLVTDTVVMVQLSFTSSEAEVRGRPQRRGHVRKPTSWPLDCLTDALMLCDRLESVEFLSRRGCC